MVTCIKSWRCCAAVNFHFIILSRMKRMYQLIHRGRVLTELNLGWACVELPLVHFLVVVANFFFWLVLLLLFLLFLLLWCCCLLTTSCLCALCSMVYTETRPKGEIAAAYGSPGPIYSLPGLVGERTHDPRSVHNKQPAFSFGVRHGKWRDDASPGPIYLPDLKYSRYGADGSPRCVGRCSGPHATLLYFRSFCFPLRFFSHPSTTFVCLPFSFWCLTLHI